MKDFKELKEPWERCESEKKETYSHGGVWSGAQFAFSGDDVHLEVG